jgi:hypothetical protein
MYRSILAQAFRACNNGAYLPTTKVRVIALTHFVRRTTRQKWGLTRMDIATSVVGFPSYPSTADVEPFKSDSGQDTQSHPEISSTQPVARRPIEQQCGDAEQDDSWASMVEQRTERGEL